MDNAFEEDVIQGLSASPKTLPSKYFYDDEGSRIFQMIMQLKEYYLTDSEYEVFSMNKEIISQAFCEDCARFDLMEFGAGDGMKTKVLLKYFLERELSFAYRPIDISGEAVEGLTKSLNEELPQLEVQGLVSDYFEALKVLSTSKQRKVVLFLGSNIGNFNDERALEFLSSVRKYLTKDDMFLIGFDLKKHPRVIHEAYDDKAGVTQAFNINLLKRINREMGANFDLDKFIHYPLYDPISGEARSYIMSIKEQEVHFSKLDTTFKFKAWEPIHTEISRKYDLEGIEALASRADFRVKQSFFDCKHYYVNSLWEIV